MKRYTFETVNGMRNFMEERGFEKRYIDRVIEHERDHFEKAKSLGADPIYVLEKRLSLMYKPWKPGIMRRKQISIQDAIDIFMAPRYPSNSDLRMANKLRRLSI